MSHIEVRNNSPMAAPIADHKNCSSSDAATSAALTPAVDDNYLRKKFKKRDRSPNSMLNESPPSASMTNVGEAAASSCQGSTPSTQLQKKEKQRPETWNKNEQQIFFNALRQVRTDSQPAGLPEKSALTLNLTAWTLERQKLRIDHSVLQRPPEALQNRRRRHCSAQQRANTPLLLQNMAQDHQVHLVANDDHAAGQRWRRREQPVELAEGHSSQLSHRLQRAHEQATPLEQKVSGQVGGVGESRVDNGARERQDHASTHAHLQGLIQDHRWYVLLIFGSFIQAGRQRFILTSSLVLVDSESVNQLPATIQVQLEPRNEAAYCRVHKLAQNPFLSIEIQTLQSVKFLIEFLENKWKNRRNQYVSFFRHFQRCLSLSSF